MYKKFLLSGALMVSLICGAAAQQAVTGCAAKKQEIEKQIAYARQHNNTYQIVGLEKALKEVNTHCTDEKLVAKVNDKIAKKQRKVSERQAELNEAKVKGDPKKIAKKVKKLNEAEAELNSEKAKLRVLFN